MISADDSKFIPLSEIIRDPELRAIFRAAERDTGDPVLIPVEPKRASLEGGAQEPVASEELERA